MSATPQEKARIGLIGLAVMGENLALNIARNGFPIAVYNRDTSKVDRFLARAQEHTQGKNVIGTYSLEDFVSALDTPRKIVLLVKAGEAVDVIADQLKPLLSAGDIIIDGGNSNYNDTNRREHDLKAEGLRFVGSGVSGGETGALWGPSLMPGGDPAAYEEIRPIWEKISAQVDDGPCVTYVGPGGAGHFVKMVHNGIEYGDMQLIAEAYGVLKHYVGLSNDELAETFTKWNEGQLNSFLIEITSKIFRAVDPETGNHLVDMVVDEAGQKGTGKWTAQIAIDIGVPIPTMQAALDARVISAHRNQRDEAHAVFEAPEVPAFTGDKDEWIAAVGDALYASKICSYAQGMNLIRAGSEKFDWGINLGELSRIWKGGCIIRAQFLDRIKQAYLNRPDLPNLLLDPYFKEWVNKAQPRWRKVVATAQTYGIPAAAISASLAYFDTYRAGKLPLNLTQAQRDFFGSHTYVRTDRPEAGAIHTEWESLIK